MLRHLNLLAGFLAGIAGYRDDLVAFLGFCYDLHVHRISAAGGAPRAGSGHERPPSAGYDRLELPAQRP